MTAKEIQQPPSVRSRPQPPRENFLANGFNFMVNGWDEGIKFLRSVKSELKRVSWPTPQELRYNTTIVIVVVAAISGYMWLVDVVLSKLFHMLHRT